jgi:glc operon protein GlcG
VFKEIPVLVRKAISYAQALAAIERMQQELKAMEAAAVLAVSDTHGELIALVCMDGAPLPSIGIAQAKAFTAARQGTASRQLALEAKAGAWSLSYFGDPRYVGWAGGLPIAIGGEVVGAVGSAVCRKTKMNGLRNSVSRRSRRGTFRQPCQLRDRRQDNQP